MTYERFTYFKNGRTVTDDIEQSGQPSASRSEPVITHVKNIRGNHQLTVRELQKRLGYPLVHAVQF
jgi:hypothetical protein